MYRFLIKPKWLLFHLVIVLAMIAMVALGFWQLRRLDERREFNAKVRTRSEQTVVALDALVPAGGTPDVATVEYLPVEFTGTYVPGLRYEFSMQRDDITGRDLYAMVELADGTVVIVDRGWLPAGTPSPALPTGEVRITGRLRQPDTGGTGQTAETGAEPVPIFRVDVNDIADDAGATPRAMYVERITALPDEPREMTPVPFPDLGEGPHFGYAVQWFLFALCTLAGWGFAVAKKVSDLKDPESVTRVDDDAPVF